jgi:GntR family transcriptional regulator/MocR family aminotransferase
MVLPQQLMAHFRQVLGFYSCTVPSFEQFTLERFLSRGYFEKHINRMRKLYKSIRNRVLTAITTCPMASHFTILEEHAGLHFLLQVDLPMTDAQLAEKCKVLGLRVAPLSSYYRFPDENSHCLVINYSGLTEESLSQLEEILCKL